MPGPANDAPADMPNAISELIVMTMDTVEMKYLRMCATSPTAGSSVRPA